MSMLQKKNYMLAVCMIVLLTGCGVPGEREGVDVNPNIDAGYADKEQLKYPTLIRASKVPEGVVYGQGSLMQDATYQYYYIYETAEQVVGSVAIDFETANVSVYGMPEDVEVRKDGDYFYLNIWTGPGENRNYIYHPEKQMLQQLAYGQIQIAGDYLYIQGIVLAVDGGAPLHIYRKDGEHVCMVTDQSIEYQIIDEYLYYIENEIIQDESGIYKLHSTVKRTMLNGENEQQICEITADTIPVIHKGYITYENNGSTYSLDFEEP